jgi:hypothetical protein
MTDARPAAHGAPSARELLRHTVATLTYRAAKAVRAAPESFATWIAGETTRTPAQILAHCGDLMDWALSIARGDETWHDSAPQHWDAEVARFFAATTRFDEFLASDAPLAVPAERLFQGPVADALTHVGQIAMLRRLSGAPVRGENYSKADIVAGRTGPDQTPPHREFG